MTSTPDGLTGHPVVVFVGDLHRALDGLGEVPGWSASPGEQATAVLELARARARLEELWLRMLAAADRTDVAAETAATSTGAWLAVQTRRDPGAAHADVRLAAALDGDRDATRRALADGAVDLDHARVIVAAVTALPADAVLEDPTLAVRAETTLLDLARTHDARKLKHLARHIAHVVDPEAAERRLGVQLEAEERAAARASYLELHDNGDGTQAGRLKLPTLHAAALTKMLDAIANPTRPTGDDGAAASPKRTRPELRGAALCELIERLPADRLPTSGGLNATVVLLLDYDVLLTGIGTAHLDTGQQISAPQARRMACEAGVIPTVIRRLVDGPSVVLDMGRRRRLHTEHMRIALTIEQGGCTAEHCDRPAGWCEAHHDQPWSQGGTTSLANGRLLCGYHHQRAHSVDYRTERIDHDRIRFHRRT